VNTQSDGCIPPFDTSSRAEFPAKHFNRICGQITRKRGTVSPIQVAIECLGGKIWEGNTSRRGPWRSAALDVGVLWQGAARVLMEWTQRWVGKPQQQSTRGTRSFSSETRRAPAFSGSVARTWEKPSCLWSTSSYGGRSIGGRNSRGDS